MHKTKTPLPTMQELTDFLNKQTREISRREIARSYLFVEMGVHLDLQHLFRID